MKRRWAAATEAKLSDGDMKGAWAESKFLLTIVTSEKLTEESQSLLGYSV